MNTPEEIHTIYQTIEECLTQQLAEIPNNLEHRHALVHVLAHITAVVIDNGETPEERFNLLSLSQRLLFTDLPIGTERKPRPSNLPPGLHKPQS